MKPAILIVGYKRPQNVSTIYKLVKDYQTRLYIFVDLDEKPPSLANDETIRLARDCQANPLVTAFIASKNFGVGKAVPAAIDWVLENEKAVIVLEDDCVPNSYTVPYLTNLLEETKYSETILLVAGSNPVSGHLRATTSVISSYPLIWGWAITKDKWNLIAPYVRNEISFLRILWRIVNNSSKIIPISFFAAAYFRSNAGITKAWDCNLALGMLLENFTGIVPNENTITNVGNDDVASHTSDPHRNSHIIIASDQKPSESIEFTSSAIDSLIAKEIYKLRIRHLLAPTKAFIQISMNKAQGAYLRSR